MSATSSATPPPDPGQDSDPEDAAPSRCDPLWSPAHRYSATVIDVDTILNAPAADVDIPLLGELQIDDVVLWSPAVSDQTYAPKLNTSKPYAPLSPEVQAVHDLAARHGGTSSIRRMPSPGYPPEWRCDADHIFRESVEAVRDEGLWCPTCVAPTISAGEARCRRIMETLLDVPFPRSHPSFLFRESTGRKLELDGYSEPLGLAFEYQGIQHYKYNPHWHKDAAGFAALQARDAEKAAKCRQHQVALIVIPHYALSGAYIRQRLAELGYIGQPLAPPPLDRPTTAPLI